MQPRNGNVLVKLSSSIEQNSGVVYLAKLLGFIPTPSCRSFNKKPQKAVTFRGCFLSIDYSLAMEASVDFTNAINSRPTSS